MENPREKWNQKHTSGSDSRAGPDPFLVDNFALLSGGTAVDLACGNGRNSTYLASRGLAVTGVDISDVALEHLRLSAREAGLAIKTEQADLEREDSRFFDALDVYNNVIIVNYKPAVELLNVLPSLVMESGIIVYCTFNSRHHDEHGFPRRFCVRPGEYRNPPPGLELIHFENLETADQFRDGYVFQKLHPTINTARGTATGY